VVRTVLGYKLPRIAVVFVPSLFTSVERTSVGVALALEIKDSVDRARRATVTDSDHNSVLIRTHDIGNAGKHKSFSYREKGMGERLTPPPNIRHQQTIRWDHPTPNR